MLSSNSFQRYPSIEIKYVIALIFFNGGKSSGFLYDRLREGPVSCLRKCGIML